MTCHFSGSTCSASAMEPCTSAKSAVTCLRSPSRALREVRIFSARCWGVYERLGRRQVRSGGERGEWLAAAPAEPYVRGDGDAAREASEFELRAALLAEADTR